MTFSPSQIFSSEKTLAHLSASPSAPSLKPCGHLTERLVRRGEARGLPPSPSESDGGPSLGGSPTWSRSLLTGWGNGPMRKKKQSRPAGDRRSAEMWKRLGYLLVIMP